MQQHYSKLEMFYDRGRVGVPVLECGDYSADIPLGVESRIGRLIHPHSRVQYVAPGKTVPEFT